MAGGEKYAELSPVLQDVVEEDVRLQRAFEDMPATPHLRTPLLEFGCRASPSTATAQLHTPDAGHAILVHVGECVEL